MPAKTQDCHFEILSPETLDHVTGGARFYPGVAIDMFDCADHQRKWWWQRMSDSTGKKACAELAKHDLAVVPVPAPR